MRRTKQRIIADIPSEWRCKYRQCKSINFAPNDTCHNCSTPYNCDWLCWNCKSFHAAHGAENCNRCSAWRYDPRAEDHDPKIHTKPPGSERNRELHDALEEAEHPVICSEPMLMAKVTHLEDRLKLTEDRLKRTEDALQKLFDTR